MERYTERHHGIAVIKNKSKYKEAMEKLCRMEEILEDDIRICKVTEEFASYICDELCKYRCGSSQEELDKHCERCKMEQFIKDIVAKYNIIIDFDNTETMKLMKKYQEYVHCDECEYCEESEDFGIPCRYCGKEDGLNGHLEPGTGCTRGEKR